MSSAGWPYARVLPLRRTMTWEQTFSTTSKTCEQYKMAFPRSASVWIKCFTIIADVTSRPESGSSRIKSDGSCRRAAMSAMRWRIPFEYEPTAEWRCGASEKSASSASIFAVKLLRGNPRSVPTSSRYSQPERNGYRSVSSGT